MLLNRDLFVKDPVDNLIPNGGVAKVGKPSQDNEWTVLKWELENFVCEGSYEEGLRRILNTFIAQLKEPEQPAVWVSGFFGSGKSHFVRVLEAIWSDFTFPDDSTARGLVNLSIDLKDLLTELTTIGRREGGLWSASGTMSGNSDVRLTMLQTVLRAAGLPTRVSTANFVLWLKKRGFLDHLKGNVIESGADWESELNNLYISTPIAENLLLVDPSFANSIGDAKLLLKETYPHSSETDITADAFLNMLQQVLEIQSTKEGHLPCTLLVFDEMQQFTGGDLTKLLQLQTTVEDCSKKFGSRLLILATGQNALLATPDLQKIQDRFSVPVHLQETDVETVVRSVVLRKAPARTPELSKTLENFSGEIDRHLGGTRIQATSGDKDTVIPDYPLLPTRRRFWQSILRAIDVAGRAGQLRTQLRLISEATRSVAEDQIGIVIPADSIFDLSLRDLQATGILSSELAHRLNEEKNGSGNAGLRYRLGALVFLIGQLQDEGPAAIGVKATLDVLTDLLIKDLGKDRLELAQKVPDELDNLCKSGLLDEVDGVYQIQTKESADWVADFKVKKNQIVNDNLRISTTREEIIEKIVNQVLSNVRKRQHGASATPREAKITFDQKIPDSGQDAVTIWVRNEWSVTANSVRTDAQKAGTDSPLILVSIPQEHSDELKNLAAEHLAAVEVISARPAPTTPEGSDARRNIEQLGKQSLIKAEKLIQSCVSDGMVLQGGGNQIKEANFADSVGDAFGNSLERMYPEFYKADHSNWGTVVTKARTGAPDALTSVDYHGEVSQHPVAIELIKYLGNDALQGSNIRKHFSDAPYGWGQDIVDGTLLSLISAGFVRATNNTNQNLSAKSINRPDMAATLFRNEETVVTGLNRIDARKLASDLGIKVGLNEEIPGIEKALKGILEVCNQINHPSPAPETPNALHIQEILSLSPNQMLLEAIKQSDNLIAFYKKCLQYSEIIKIRWPNWLVLKDLLRHAENLDIPDNIKEDVKVIEDQRQLLGEPDPVQPILNQLESQLRTELRILRSKITATLEKEQHNLDDQLLWKQLDEAQKEHILRSKNLDNLVDIEIPDAPALVTHLDFEPLKMLESKLAALPAQFSQLIEEITKQDAPDTQIIHKPPVIINTIEELDSYINDIRKEVTPHLKEGNRVLIRR